MDPFEQFKSDWKNQDEAANVDLEYLKNKAHAEIKRQQRKLIFANLFTSVAFAAVFIVLAWIWTSMPERSTYFYISLIAMSVLLLITLIGIWAGVQFKNENAYQSPKAYVNQHLKKLKIRKFMLEKFMPVYLVLLLGTFYLYYADILSGASPRFILSAYGMTTAYFAIMYAFSRKKLHKKLKEIETLRAKLHRWRQELD
ncbi:hypothetical protein Q3O59_06600 [Alkalimonas delamerensis]|uniref:Uncharacterized protein n=1 Tax=Alkalimonas delamerensis TaxID=265981 RepID=A0ABT9GPJ1_9GAMM|nr:hypothetical protein [Alkalimonas delamerensis]MDP4528700.1 hypothetical protein [Alkalimonas delamerensis]